MQEKIKNIVVVAAFSLFLLVFSILCITAHFDPQTHSDSENRELAQLPTNITWEGILDRTVINKFEDASVDQFPFRDFFRGLKANFQYNVLSLKENNGYVVENGYICEIKTEFNQNGLESSITKLEDLYLSQIKAYPCLRAFRPHGNGRKQRGVLRYHNQKRTRISNRKRCCNRP